MRKKLTRIGNEADILRCDFCMNSSYTTVLLFFSMTNDWMLLGDLRFELDMLLESVSSTIKRAEEWLNTLDNYTSGVDGPIRIEDHFTGVTLLDSKFIVLAIDHFSALMT